MSLKIAFIGYGKLSKMVEKIALERGHQTVLIINSKNQDQLNHIHSSDIDIAIELTNPESAYYNIKKCLDAKIPVVSGTTGWHDHLKEIQSYCLKQNGSLLTATNFSPGVNIVFKINEILARYIKHVEGYQVSIEETHHIHKKDHPSGTGITLAQGIINNFNHYNTYHGFLAEDKDNQSIQSNEIPIVCYREDEIPGTHSVKYNSTIDSIELKHEAHNREGFALGAILAAEYIYNKKGVFTMNEVLGLS